MSLGRLILPLLFLTAACAAPGPTPDFQDLQAEQAAIQAALADPRDGIAHAWRGGDGMAGAVTVLGPAAEEGCRRLRAERPDGASEDVWCPTAHGFWVHPEEIFYRNATGRETYGGSVRSRDITDTPARPAGGADARPSHGDCLDHYRAARAFDREGRAAKARAAERDFHRCMQRAN